MATAPQTNEKKLTNAIVKALDSHSFNKAHFAELMSHTGIKMQSELMDAMNACIRVWSDNYDRGLWDTAEEMNLYAKARRIQDMYEAFQPERDGT
jgi:hypothetical protein